MKETFQKHRNLMYLMSFGGQPGSGGFVSSRSEPISLATLDKDCFIIPVHSLDRFLPAGIPLPTPETTDASQQGPLSVLEVSDPKICILAHLMSPLEPIEPLLESPLAHPLSKQRAVASELLNEVQQGNNAVGGMLLANMERSSVSFGGQPGSGGFVSSRSEPISLATLDKDCFIIPVHSLDRFLPAGIPLPTPETTDASQQGPLSVLEVSDPKICILAHLMSPLEPIEPLLESPLSHPLSKQRAVASELLNEVQQGNNAVGGMLLANMERSSVFELTTFGLRVQPPPAIPPE
ncbi:conserved hypothetical protein [Culex quinquefasciatus]|uniref:Uncharacterized protein n=1 Tax=Culex quinquefasciatus TaxID=7176 RepID=B0WTG5_CULQU|nr:conserved hypothetical protein [Culex quinquefasciatus]|eukprot:XP_001870885.1 conserved hypothetical protein [Culex quinquefasciatus]